MWKRDYEDALEREKQYRLREQESTSREHGLRDSLAEYQRREEHERDRRRKAEERAKEAEEEARAYKFARDNAEQVAKRVREENRHCNQQIDDLYNQNSDLTKAADDAREEKERLQRELERARASAAIASTLPGTSADATQRQRDIEAKEEQLRQKEVEIARREAAIEEEARRKEAEVARREAAVEDGERRVQVARDQLARDGRPATPDLTMTRPYATPQGNVVAEHQLNKSFDTLGEKKDETFLELLPPMSEFSFNSDLFNNLATPPDSEHFVLDDFDLSLLDEL
jgi:DNA repair exonuclease SbcCD ATPase subunit